MLGELDLEKVLLGTPPGWRRATGVVGEARIGQQVRATGLTTWVTDSRSLLLPAAMTKWPSAALKDW